MENFLHISYVVTCGLFFVGVEQSNCDNDDFLLQRHKFLMGGILQRSFSVLGQEAQQGKTPSSSSSSHLVSFSLSLSVFFHVFIFLCIIDKP